MEILSVAGLIRFSTSDGSAINILSLNGVNAARVSMESVTLIKLHKMLSHSLIHRHPSGDSVTKSSCALLTELVDRSGVILQTSYNGIWVPRILRLLHSYQWFPAIRIFLITGRINFETGGFHLWDMGPSFVDLYEKLSSINLLRAIVNLVSCYLLVDQKTITTSSLDNNPFMPWSTTSTLGRMCSMISENQKAKWRIETAQIGY